MTSVRSALAMTLRPVSVFVGIVAAGIVSSAVELVALAIAWYAHQPTTGLLFWALSLVGVTVSGAVGGYVAARLSRSRGLAAAIAVGVIGLLVPVMSILSDPTGWWPAWWMTSAFLVLFVQAAAAGGWFAAASGSSGPGRRRGSR